MTYKERVTELLNNAKEIVSSDPESSFKYVLELYSELKESNDYDSIGRLCKLIASIYLRNGQYLKAEDYNNEGIANFKLVNNNDEIGNIYSNMVIVSYYLDKFDNIELYSHLALQYFRRSETIDGIVAVTNNLARYYKNIKNYDKAYSLLEETLSAYGDVMARDKRAIILSAYANVIIKRGDLEEGHKILLDLYKEFEKIKKYQVLSVVNLYLTEYYESIGDYKSALFHHKKRHNNVLLGNQEEASSQLNKYLSNFNIDVDRIQYDRVVKQNEELLKTNNIVSKKNGFLQTLLDTIPLPLYFLDLDYKYMGCNDAFTEYFNVDKKYVTGQKVGFSIPNNDEKSFITNKKFKLEGSQKTSHIATNITRDGKDIRTIELFNSMFSDENGELAGTLGLIKDITQEIEQQNQVKEINAHLKSILESASQVYICSIDRNYNYRYFNKNYVDSVKRHIGKVITKGSSYFDRYQTESEIKAKRILLDKVFSGQVISGIREYEDLIPPEILQYYYSPIIEEGGEVIGATVFSYDITERVLAQKELALANKTKDKFFSIIAHDLRSPIGNIKSALEFITQEEDIASSEKMDMLEKLASSAVNTYDLLENLLQWSLSQRGLIKNYSNTFLLSGLIDEVIGLSGNIANSKKIELKVNCAKDIKVFVDKNMFFTILRNLLSNAIKYSYQNSIINVEVESDKDFVLIKVIDHGVGIKQEVIPYLNNMDKSITTYGTGGEKGSGLGLVLCHELVLNLGGKIWVESAEGKGSTFSFTLPTQEIY